MFEKLFFIVVFFKGVPGLQRENWEDGHNCLYRQLACLQIDPRSLLEDGNLAIPICISCFSKLLLFYPDLDLGSFVEFVQPKL